MRACVRVRALCARLVFVLHPKWQSLYVVADGIGPTAPGSPPPHAAMPLLQCGACGTNVATEEQWCHCRCGGWLKNPHPPVLPAAEPAAAAAPPVAEPDVVDDEAGAGAGFLRPGRDCRDPRDGPKPDSGGVVKKM